MEKKIHGVSRVLLDPDKESDIRREFLAFMRTRVVGQDRIIEKIAEILEKTMAGFRSRTQPIGSILCLGPSRTGKTLIAKALAEFLFGSPEAMTRFDCQDYSQYHQVANLLGAPQGYVGYDDETILTQSKLDRFARQAESRGFIRGLYGSDVGRFHELQEKLKELEKRAKAHKGSESTEAQQVRAELERTWEEFAQMRTLAFDGWRGEYLSVVLFDEVEKAHRAFHNLMLRILDEGVLHLSPRKSDTKKEGTNKVDFTNSIIFATSNLGDSEIEELLLTQNGSRVRMGIHGGEAISAKDFDHMVYTIATEAARIGLNRPLLNRFSSVVAARPLTKAEFGEILELQIKQLQEALVEEWEFPMLLKISRRARAFIVDKATDKPEEQAALIEKKLKHYIIDNLARLRLTGQIHEGDIVEVVLRTHDGRDRILFFRLPHNTNKKILVMS